MKNLFRKLVAPAAALGLLLGMTATGWAQGVLPSSGPITPPSPGYRYFVDSKLGSDYSYDYYSLYGSSLNRYPITLPVVTQVCIFPWLYVFGDLDYKFQVYGWGEGDSPTEDSHITIQHNMELLVSFTGFDNPYYIDVLGQKKSIEMYLSAFYYNLGTYGLDYSFNPFSLTPETPAPRFNSAYTFYPAHTGGEFELHLDRRIHVKPGDGPLPGSSYYTNTGYLNLTPVW